MTKEQISKLKTLEGKYQLNKYETIFDLKKFITGHLGFIEGYGWGSKVVKPYIMRLEQVFDAHFKTNKT